MFHGTTSTNVTLAKFSNFSYFLPKYRNNNINQWIIIVLKMELYST